MTVTTSHLNTHQTINARRPCTCLFKWRAYIHAQPSFSYSCVRAHDSIAWLFFHVPTESAETSHVFFGYLCLPPHSHSIRLHERFVFVFFFSFQTIICVIIFTSILCYGELEMTVPSNCYRFVGCHFDLRHIFRWCSFLYRISTEKKRKKRNSALRFCFCVAYLTCIYAFSP